MLGALCGVVLAASALNRFGIRVKPIAGFALEALGFRTDQLTLCAVIFSFFIVAGDALAVLPSEARRTSILRAACLLPVVRALDAVRIASHALMAEVAIENGVVLCALIAGVAAA